MNKPIENHREGTVCLTAASEIKLKEVDEEIPVTTTKEIQHLFYHKSPANKTIYKIHAESNYTQDTFKTLLKHSLHHSTE